MKKRRLLRQLSFLLIMFFACTSLCAQQLNATYQSYIEQYSSMAIDQMKRHRIPASITLAQGLLESGAGRSYLAVHANNHFGIKVGGSWTGPYVVRGDDRPDDRFRKYASVADSYEDHSLFLKKSRYAMLFEGDIKDYRYWARGLKSCGYATSPTYAESLIRLIELYKLYQYDNGKLLTNTKEIDKIMKGHDADFFASHPVMENNKNYYIRVQRGDNLASISQAVGVSEKRLRKYNEIPKGYEAAEGSVLYLESKRSSADKAFKHHPHTITSGQSMYDIVQMYGMKLKSLYKKNNLSPDYQPVVGDQLKVY